ncbi:MAG: hypothetical protein JO154_02500 [Chitinophaga sp.]|uniref:hypothetical protein n=1 Tax=Chitinophaga sp. TaxID=1869181 RepID=UPI0025BBB775|nr:hypothetical protein [Chitinophaga sp.]MBV8251450.1 hypothetical protein [Chitinophaga sp.]
MKKLILLAVLLGGVVTSTYAQRGHAWGHYKHRDCDDDRWERRREREYRHWDDDCYRPRRRVVVYDRPYYRPAYYVPAPPVVPVPVPVPVGRPRAVIHAGVTIVN